MSPFNANPRTSADAASRSAAHIVIGITGGIAAYKTCVLTRLFVKAGVRVQVVMTAAACEFVTPITLQALSGNRVITDLWDASFPDNMAHIALSREADLILVAPATADFMAKVANGLADDLVSTLCLARPHARCPLLLAPAMNREMWENPATVRNAATLVADGVELLGPAPGDQACGETGMGRMLEPQVLFEAVMARLADLKPGRPQANERRVMGSGSAFAGRRVLVTAGPTVEPIDPVRSITNMSSGKMGYAIAAALRDAGASVTLISGPTQLEAPAGVKRVDVQTASQMLDAVNTVLADFDAFFAVAAVADYTPDRTSAEKIKKSRENLTLELVPTVDILAASAVAHPKLFCVGFAAETHNIVENASKKREKKQIAMIVANHAGTAIGADSNSVTIIDANGATPIPHGPKTDVAHAIVSHAALLFAKVATAASGITTPSTT